MYECNVHLKDFATLWLQFNPNISVFREILVEESNVQRVDSPVTVSNII